MKPKKLTARQLWEWSRDAFAEHLREDYHGKPYASYTWENAGLRERKRVFADVAARVHKHYSDK
jgi:hypothetical protein